MEQDEYEYMNTEVKRKKVQAYMLTLDQPPQGSNN
jgi:hypothetical protein